MSDKPRVVCWFSCGAASAMATLMARKKYGEVEAVYCRVRNEHPDNLRFIDDFVCKTGQPVKIIANRKYAGDIYEVFLKRGYIKNQYGAPCTMLLKKDMRKEYQLPTDIQVFGYTSEEQDRADRFLDANNEVNECFPLIDSGITKRNCLDGVKYLGIEVPMMYRLGYQNNNCVGCVKGGMGYWNQIRKDFPLEFQRMAKMERALNYAINKDKNGSVFLDELAPGRGNFKKDSPGDCGFTCELNKP